jgi:hypothetical protein
VRTTSSVEHETLARICAYLLTRLQLTTVARVFANSATLPYPDWFLSDVFSLHHGLRTQRPLWWRVVPEQRLSI